MLQDVGSGAHDRVLAPPVTLHCGAEGREVRCELIPVSSQGTVGCAAFGAPRIHEGFGVEEVGVDEGREQHPDPCRDGKWIATADSGDLPASGGELERGREIENVVCESCDFGARLVVFAFAVRGARAEEPCIQARLPIREARMMACDNVRKRASNLPADLAKAAVKGFQGVQRSCGGVGPFTVARQLALDVCIVDLSDVLLEPRSVLSEVMPEPR
ncbi:MAG TPA: hypothetical protein PKC22_17495, partial [Rhodocyclaceae bacterium]|nr:hypothetical protein [Rhodocyclaceae bacterium]